MTSASFKGIPRSGSSVSKAAAFDQTPPDSSSDDEGMPATGCFSSPRPKKPSSWKSRSAVYPA